MTRNDANQIAARILWQTLRHHGAMEKLRAIEFRKAWRAAAGIINRTPPGTRPRSRKLTPQQLARIGTVEGL